VPPSAQPAKVLPPRILRLHVIATRDRFLPPVNAVPHRRKQFMNLVEERIRPGICIEFQPAHALLVGGTEPLVAGRRAANMDRQEGGLATLRKITPEKADRLARALVWQRDLHVADNSGRSA